MADDAPLYNVSYAGECDACGNHMMFTGFRAATLLRKNGERTDLGMVGPDLVECVVCEDGNVALRCVGLAVDPYVAQLPDEEFE